ncbi:MAG: pyridoxamine 5'-phosphate oxidase family protein [Alphaproteobacteria bacterium]|nr:pyridoxamine 5'-phosphate oxidase family protein [Alphaproteobacteria bacterium]
MPRNGSSKAPSERMRVKRLPDRGHYDRETIHAILDAGLICHVGYVIDGQPYVTPTGYWREGDRVYWHGSSASRMLRQQKEGIPVCFTVSLLDGLVFARSGFHHSMNYRAVMALGTAQLVEGDEAKLATLEAFSERIAPGRWREIRPPTAQELKGTTILHMGLEEASAKIRTGDPVDDEEDYALPCWAGVLPIRLTTGTPLPDAKLPAGVAPPDYFRRLKLG